MGRSNDELPDRHKSELGDNEIKWYPKLYVVDKLATHFVHFALNT